MALWIVINIPFCFKIIPLPQELMIEPLGAGEIFFFGEVFEMGRREKVLLTRQKMVTPQGTLVLVQQTVHRVILPMIRLCTQFL